MVLEMFQSRLSTRAGKVERMTIARYIPHALCEEYYCQGWTVLTLGRYHGTFSMLATIRL